MRDQFFKCIKRTLCISTSMSATNENNAYPISQLLKLYIGPFLGKKQVIQNESENNLSKQLITFLEIIIDKKACQGRISLPFFLCIHPSIVLNLKMQEKESMIFPLQVIRVTRMVFDISSTLSGPTMSWEKKCFI